MLAESQGLESAMVNSWGDGTQSAGALIQLGLLEPGEAEVLSLTKAPLFCMKQIESCCNVDLMVLELAESNDLGQEAPVPIALDLVGQPREEGTTPLEHFQEPTGGGQSDAVIVAFVRGGIDFGDEGGVLWVVAAGVPRDLSVYKLLDPMCRFEEVVLNGDDKASGMPIAIEGEALGTFFGGAMVLDAGLHVFQAAVLAPQ